jgi:hypothetical protein
MAHGGGFFCILVTQRCPSAQTHQVPAWAGQETLPNAALEAVLATIGLSVAMRCTCAIPRGACQVTRAETGTH